MWEYWWCHPGRCLVRVSSALWRYVRTWIHSVYSLYASACACTIIIPTLLCVVIANSKFLFLVAVCPDLPTSINGSVDYNAGTVNSRPVNTVATYTCTSDYALMGYTSRTCGSDMMWSGLTPTCQCDFFLCEQVLPLILFFLTVVDCGALLNPANGAVNTSSGTTFMNNAKYTCTTAGYVLVGDATRTCQSDGEWSSTSPTCAGKLVHLSSLTD